MRGLLALVVLAGCDEGPATIAVVSPDDGATVCGDPLVVELDVRGLQLVEPTGDPRETGNGTGHVDLALNGQEAAMVWTEHAEIAGVVDGVYQLKAELSNSDHTPVEPYAGDLIYVTVAEDACGS
jgi:hypothetical protein